MGSLNYAQTRSLLAESTAATVVDDTPVAIRIKYKGTGSVSSVVVDTDEDITLTSSDGGTEAFLFSSYTTMGTLVDAINASAYWEAKLLDALRSDNTSGSPFVDNAGVSVSDDGYYDALIDTSAATDTSSNYIYTYRVTYDRGVDTNKPSGAHRVKLQEVVYNVDVNAAMANGFRIYKWDAAAKTETQIYRKASVDATETTVNFASGNGAITGGDNNDLIVRVADDTSITDATDNFLECVYVKE